ncbi:MAG: sigma-70 family RNA polymerase sigma factor, partial [Odoribacter sp.]
MAGIDIFKKHSKKQEEDNYKALFREYFASMCLFAEHYLGDYEMARDAVHDVFCRLWESAVCFDGIENKKGYLYTIVRNHCLDLIKRRNVRDRYAQNNVLVEEEGETALEIEMLREEIYNLLDKAIAQLPA